MTDDEKVDDMLNQMGHVWKTKSSYMSWLRGSIRRSLWSKNPVKLEFIKKNRIKIPNPNPKGRVVEVWGGVCALTGITFPISEMEVDHKVGNFSLRSIGDLESFIKSIAVVTMDDLQLVSKDAHKIKTHAEKNGVSFEEAKADKEAKRLVDNKLDIQFLKDHNVEQASTQAKRRKQIYEILINGGGE